MAKATCTKGEYACFKRCGTMKDEPELAPPKEKKTP